MNGGFNRLVISWIGWLIEKKIDINVFENGELLNRDNNEGG
jgi:hypothetical protein